MTTSPQSLATEARRLCAAATPGPWRPKREPPPVGNAWFDALPDGSVPIESTGTNMALGVAVAGTVGRADAAFIARFRTLGPELATAIEALMAERDALAEALDFCGATAALGYRGDPNRMLAALERILVEVRTARRALARKVE